MKPTERQQEIINTIIGVMQTWVTSNDLNSLSHENYIEEMIAWDYEDNIADKVEELLNLIRKEQHD